MFSLTNGRTLDLLIQHNKRYFTIKAINGVYDQSFIKKRKRKIKEVNFTFTSFLRLQKREKN